MDEEKVADHIEQVGGQIKSKGMRVFPAERRSAERTTQVFLLSVPGKNTHVGSCSGSTSAAPSHTGSFWWIENTRSVREEPKENGCSNGLAYSGFHL